jgi:hypothetical protein
MRRIAILIAVAAAVVPAATKDRDWETGTLLDAQNNPYFGRTNGSLDGTSLPFVGVMTASGLDVSNVPPSQNFVLDRYVIESETDVYLVQNMRIKSSKPFPLSANMPVKFAVEKKKLWLLNADGQELQTNIAKRKQKFQPTKRFQASQ